MLGQDRSSVEGRRNLSHSEQSVEQEDEEDRSSSGEQAVGVLGQVVEERTEDDRLDDARPLLDHDRTLVVPDELVLSDRAGLDLSPEGDGLSEKSRCQRATGTKVMWEVQTHVRVVLARTLGLLLSDGLLELLGLCLEPSRVGEVLIELSVGGLGDLGREVRSGELLGRVGDGSPLNSDNRWPCQPNFCV